MKWHKWIIPILGVLIGIGVISYNLWDIEDQGEHYAKQIDVLLNENQDLTNANYMLDSTLVTLQHKTDSLVLLIEDLKIHTMILKKRKNEKSARITSFSNDELYRYFTRFNTQKDTAR